MASAVGAASGGAADVGSFDLTIPALDFGGGGGVATTIDAGIAIGGGSSSVFSLDLAPIVITPGVATSTTASAPANGGGTVNYTPGMSSATTGTPSGNSFDIGLQPAYTPLTGGGSQPGDYVPGTRYSLDANGNLVQAGAPTPQAAQASRDYAGVGPNGGSPVPNLGALPDHIVGTEGRYGYKWITMPANTSIADIAAQGGYDLRELVQLNGTGMTAGFMIMVPKSPQEASGGGFTQPAAAQSTQNGGSAGSAGSEAPPAAPYKWVAMPANQTLAQFAAANGYNLAELQSLNGTSPAAGMMIEVPSKSGPPTLPSAPPPARQTR